MAHTILKTAEPYYIAKAKPKKNGAYLDFLHRLPCVVSGARTDIQAAHLSFASPKHGHYGRAKGTKAPDRWALPLSSTEHDRQHSMNEQAYWAAVGLDPHLIALAIFGLWADLGADAYPHAEAIINQGLARVGRLRERELS